jgi:putative transcriptional regulator
VNSLEAVDELSTKIAGEISLSENPSNTLKKWRELFGLTQSELARHLNTTPSVVNDYESGRRKSPGTKLVRRFVDAIIRADAINGYPVVKSYEKSHFSNSLQGVIIDMSEFKSPLSIHELATVIGGEVATGKELPDTKIFGYTVIDSIKAILELSSNDFLRLYGTTTQRALIFTKVSYGRSPLIAVRVATIKPKVIVMHGVKEIDKLGLKIAEKESIPVILTEIGLDSMLKKLRGRAL